MSWQRGLDNYQRKQDEKARRMRRNNGLWAVAMFGLFIVVCVGVGICQSYAPCETWRGATVENVPVRCLGELTR